MAISLITPTSGSTIDPGDAFSFTITDGWATLSVEVDTDLATEYAYDSALGGAQAGYTVVVTPGAGDAVYTISRDSGFNISPTNIRIIEDAATTAISYSLTAEQLFPQGKAPYNPLSTTPAPSGDVEGPGSSTDNAVARFDGTGGKTLQNSLVTISDTGAIATPSTVAATETVATDEYLLSLKGAVIQETAGPPLGGGIPTLGQFWVNNATSPNKPFFTDESGANIDLSGGGGSGDVVGPGSAVDENIAVFDSTTGKLIKDGLITKAQVQANTAKVTNATHTGDVTGATALTIAANAVTNSKILNATIVATDKLSATGTKDATTFLRGDNTWDVPAGGGGSGAILDTQTKADSTEAFFDFDTTSIPANHDLYFHFRTAQTTGSAGNNVLRFNGDTGNNYTQAEVRVSAIGGVGVSGNNGTGQPYISVGLVTDTTKTTGDWSEGTFKIPSAGWQGTAARAILFGDAWEDGTNTIVAARSVTGGSWNNTSAVTSIRILLSVAANFLVDSTVTMVAVPQYTWGSGGGGGGGAAKVVFAQQGAVPTAPTVNTWYTPDDRIINFDGLWSLTLGTGTDPAPQIYEPAFIVPFDGILTDIDCWLRSTSVSNNGYFAVYKWTPTDDSATVGTLTQLGTNMTFTPAAANRTYDLSQTGLSAAVSKGDKIKIFYRGAAASPLGGMYFTASLLVEAT